ncbi:MAG: hypothetical protein DUD27_02675 [Lachnospiraceae bacterium]|nr:MAG: hypothetical protein DUD27_02675 [Lachnospiraceae bacterium]
MSLFTDALIDATIDTLKLIPFLYITYLLMEILERHTSDKQVQLMAKVDKFGPAIGAAVGAVPQCGFSAAAASLYSGGVISVGTLIAVFASTSDEMLPLFISQHVALGKMLSILVTKAFLGMISGFGIDFIVRHTKYHIKSEKHIRDICEREHCGTAEDEHTNVFLAALKHTLQIVIFIFIISVVLTLVVDGVGKNAVASVIAGNPVLGVLLSTLIGLIPNCAASVMITQLYIDGLMSAGQMIAGLVVGAGVGLMVLFRTNDNHMKENIVITIMLYCVGVFWGLIFEGLGIVF